MSIVAASTATPTSYRSVPTRIRTSSSSAGGLRGRRAASPMNAPFGDGSSLWSSSRRRSLSPRSSRTSCCPRDVADCVDAKPSRTLGRNRCATSA